MGGFIIGFILVGLLFLYLPWYEFWCGVWNKKYGRNDWTTLDY